MKALIGLPTVSIGGAPLAVAGATFSLGENGVLDLGAGNTIMLRSRPESRSAGGKHGELSSTHGDPKASRDLPTETGESDIVGFSQGRSGRKKSAAVQLRSTTLQYLLILFSIMIEYWFVW